MIEVGQEDSNHGSPTIRIDNWKPIVGLQNKWLHGVVGGERRLRMVISAWRARAVKGGQTGRKKISQAGRGKRRDVRKEGAKREGTEGQGGRRDEEKFNQKNEVKPHPSAKGRCSAIAEDGASAVKDHQEGAAQEQDRGERTEKNECWDVSKEWRRMSQSCKYVALYCAMSRLLFSTVFVLSFAFSKRCAHPNVAR